MPATIRSCSWVFNPFGLLLLLRLLVYGRRRARRLSICIIADFPPFCVYDFEFSFLPLPFSCVLLPCHSLRCDIYIGIPWLRENLPPVRSAAILRHNPRPPPSSSITTTFQHLVGCIVYAVDDLPLPILLLLCVSTTLYHYAHPMFVFCPSLLFSCSGSPETRAAHISTPP
jgi:hypothetical protein